MVTDTKSERETCSGSMKHGKINAKHRKERKDEK